MYRDFQLIDEHFIEGTSEKREWKLEKDSELRFEVELQNEAQLLVCSQFLLVFQ